jgi:hypothetical protein
VRGRAWIAQLIDHGTPYIENVPKLKPDFKFDLGLVRAIHGRTITLGDMVAHGLSSRESRITKAGYLASAGSVV